MSRDKLWVNPVLARGSTTFKNRGKEWRGYIWQFFAHFAYWPLALHFLVIFFCWLLNCWIKDLHFRYDSMFIVWSFQGLSHLKHAVQKRVGRWNCVGTSQYITQTWRDLHGRSVVLGGPLVAIWDHLGPEMGQISSFGHGEGGIGTLQDRSWSRSLSRVFTHDPSGSLEPERQQRPKQSEWW